MLSCMLLGGCTARLAETLEILQIFVLVDFGF
jgi:hypothetical protein